MLTASRPGSRINAFASGTLQAPARAKRLGSIDHPSGIGGGELLRLSSGIYVCREADVIRTVNQAAVRRLLAGAA